MDKDEIRAHLVKLSKSFQKDLSDRKLNYTFKLDWRNYSLEIDCEDSYTSAQIGNILASISPTYWIEENIKSSSSFFYNAQKIIQPETNQDIASCTLQ